MALALLDKLIADVRGASSSDHDAGHYTILQVGDSVQATSPLSSWVARTVRHATIEVTDDQHERELAVWARVRNVFREFCLSPLAMIAAKKWVREMAEPKSVSLKRLREWLLQRVNWRECASPVSAWQLGCPEVLCGLRAEPIWDTDALEWLRPFKENVHAIRKELLALRQAPGFQPLKIPNWASKNKIASPDGVGSISHDAGNWNVFYLQLHEMKFEENCARCPITSSLLKDLPRSYQHAFFSALTPGTHILKHHGPTNKKLRVHLPLIGAEGARLRVADQIVTYNLERDGCPIVFDDSFEHEAWHLGESTRIMLVFDVWHPDFSDREVQFFSFLQRARMRAEMAAEQNARLGAQKHDVNVRCAISQPVMGVGENIYQLLYDASDMLRDYSWWV